MMLMADDDRSGNPNDTLMQPNMPKADTDENDNAKIWKTRTQRSEGVGGSWKGKEGQGGEVKGGGAISLKYLRTEELRCSQLRRELEIP